MQFFLFTRKVAQTDGQKDGQTDTCTKAICNPPSGGNITRNLRVSQNYVTNATFWYFADAQDTIGISYTSNFESIQCVAEILKV